MPSRINIEVGRASDVAPSSAKGRARKIEGTHISSHDAIHWSSRKLDPKSHRSDQQQSL